MFGRRRRGGAVGQRDDAVAVLVARSHRRLDAAVGEESGEDDRLDSLAAQNEIDVGAREGVEAALALDEDVALRRGEIVDDRGTPRALHEGVAVDDALEDSVRVPCQFAVARREGDGCVHDRHACGTGLVDECDGVGQHPRRVHDLGDGVVQNASVAGELVLVLDEHQCGGCGVEGERVVGHEYSQCAVIGVTRIQLRAGSSRKVVGERASSPNR